MRFSGKRGSHETYPPKKWMQTLQSHIWIFNVGRGLSILIRTALNQGILYYFGCSKDFSPSKFMEKKLLQKISG